MPVLQVKRLTKHFGGLAAAVGVDLAVNADEVVGLIGPNGAGKTTVFNLISGQLRPNSGRIEFKGRDITGLKPSRICRMGIARTWQLVDLFGSLTVMENVLTGLMFGASSVPRKGPAADRCQEILEFVGLGGVSRTPAADLTIAQQKRLEVARALATDPDLLLLDELMAGLTPAEVAAAMVLVKRIRDQGRSILMIEHVMKAIMDVSDRIVVLHYGEKIAEGSPETVAADDRVKEVYLGA